MERRLFGQALLSSDVIGSLEMWLDSMLDHRALRLESLRTYQPAMRASHLWAESNSNAQDPLFNAKRGTMSAL
jgi:hypothetical protein